MGFAAENLQVRTGTASGRHADVVAALRRTLCEGPWALREVVGRERPQRVLAVAPADDTSWITVFERNPTRATHAQLGSGLSALLRTAAVSVSAYDTDVDLVLYREGHETDRLAFVVAGSPSRPGDPTRWQDLMTDPAADPDALRRVWTPSEVPRRGAVLGATADLLGWNSAIARDTFAEFAARRVAGATVLSLRRDGPPPPALISCRDPEHPPVRAHVGVPMALQLPVMSMGGDGLGVSVVVSGPDVAAGAVVVHSAAILPAGQIVAFQPHAAPGGAVTEWRADFADVTLFGQGEVVYTDPARAQKAMYDAILTFEIECVLERPGGASFRVAVEPMESPDLGRVTENMLLVT